MSLDQVYAHVSASGYFPFIRRYHEDGEGWRGCIDLAVLPLLAVDDRFTCTGWPDWALHQEVGPDLIGYRSRNGRLGSGSLQIVISQTTADADNFWADVDHHNPADVVGAVRHFFHDMLPGWFGFGDEPKKGQADG